MATISRKIEYPTGDGKPMAETDLHRDLMFDLIKSLQEFYADDPMTYVSGNLLLFYEEGNKRRHLAPDVFVVRGIPKRERLNYLLWEEGKGPDLAIELTSKSTRREDQSTKSDLYRDVLHVSEYFLFDPLAEYLKPPLQGFRLMNGEYTSIEPDAERLPSLVTGLHLEALGKSLRLYSPELGRVLPTPLERAMEAEAEVERRRNELETLRRATKG
jgi:Uma2 family endonuclease